MPDLVGKLDTSIDGLHYVSIFRYYGNEIEDGIDPLVLRRVDRSGIELAALGAVFFDRRDLSG